MRSSANAGSVAAPLTSASPTAISWIADATEPAPQFLDVRAYSFSLNGGTPTCRARSGPLSLLFDASR